MAQAALLADILPRQISFKHSLQLWIAWSQLCVHADPERNESILFILMAQRKIGNRPGRIEPRVIKRRPKPFSLLMKPRAEARAEVRRNGHPEKLK
jgi:hypothetical protein